MDLTHHYFEGVILAQELRATTRLAVRAAQEQVPLAATGGGDGATKAARAVREFLGEWVALNVTPEGVQLGPATRDEIADAQRIDYGGSAFTRNARVRLADRLECRPLREATAEWAGAKAAACGDLTRIAERPGSGFKAPGGVFIPFGSMEACLRDAGRGEELLRMVATVDTVVRLGDSLAIDAACQAVRALITSTPFPPEMAATLCAAFPLAPENGGGGGSGGGVGGGGRLVVRSSSNVEDLAGMSGAGLYRSVLVRLYLNIVEGSSTPQSGKPLLLLAVTQFFFNNLSMWLERESTDLDTQSQSFHPTLLADVQDDLSYLATRSPGF